MGRLLAKTPADRFADAGPAHEHDHQVRPIDVEVFGLTLEVRDGREAGLEGQREQERKQDLHAGLRYPHLLQDFSVGPVGPLHPTRVADSSRSASAPD